ncbi:MAG: hypothetical protein RL411_1144, partial [Bacteroidota bacterium]
VRLWNADGDSMRILLFLVCACAMGWPASAASRTAMIVLRRIFVAFMLRWLNI